LPWPKTSVVNPYAKIAMLAHKLRHKAGTSDFVGCYFNQSGWFKCN
jgi:hypothetical protein